MVGIMKLKKMELETVCGITSTLPVNLQPEVAFAGRSNVGKSSLINGLLNRKSFARTSSQPGKTQTINFYHINDEFYFVDLPGYGYAKVSAELKAKWGKMIERYLMGSKQLKCVFLLVDIRHAPTKDDLTMNAFLRSTGLPFYVIATKLDKISRAQLLPCLTLLYRTLSVQPWQVLPYSSETGEGRDQLLALIEQTLIQENSAEPE